MIVGLLSGQGYMLKVAARNRYEAGSEASAYDWADCERPGKPAFLAAESGDGGLYVSWREPLTDGGSDIARFNVLWRKVGAKGFTSVTVPYSAYRTKTIVTHTLKCWEIRLPASAAVAGLENGARYYVLVSATNTGRSDRSGAPTFVVGMP